jgi:hypothetical protein
MEQENTTAVEPVSTRSAGIRYGLIGGVIGIAYFLILNTAGMDTTQGFWNWFRFVITIGILIFAHKYYKDNNDSFMSYGQGVGISFWTGLIASLIGGVFMFIYVKFIDASFIEMMKQNQITAMQERGMSDAQIDQSMKIASMFMSPLVIFIFAIVFGIIGNVIGGLIVSIFTQKKAPEQAF